MILWRKRSFFGFYHRVFGHIVVDRRLVVRGIVGRLGMVVAFVVGQVGIFDRVVGNLEDSVVPVGNLEGFEASGGNPEAAEVVPAVGKVGSGYVVHRRLEVRCSWFRFLSLGKWSNFISVSLI